MTHATNERANAHNKHDHQWRHSEHHWTTKRWWWRPWTRPRWLDESFSPWGYTESNCGPHPYQGCALTDWAIAPRVGHRTLSGQRGEPQLRSSTELSAMWTDRCFVVAGWRSTTSSSSTDTRMPPTKSVIKLNKVYISKENYLTVNSMKKNK